MVLLKITARILHHLVGHWMGLSVPGAPLLVSLKDSVLFLIFSGHFIRQLVCFLIPLFVKFDDSNLKRSRMSVDRKSFVTVTSRYSWRYHKYHSQLHESLPNIISCVKTGSVFNDWSITSKLVCFFESFVTVYCTEQIDNSGRQHSVHSRIRFGHIITCCSRLRAPPSLPPCG